MRITTIGSIALLAVSSAALAQVATQPHTMHDNTMSTNSTAPMNSTMPMNTQDETMMNDMSAPDTTAPNATTTLP